MVTSEAIQQIILVDENDQETGLMEKMEVHQKGLLHRAFSVFIFNSNGQILLQRRAAHKYHSGGLWSNTCCSHPQAGESSIDAANRRLYEEMGMKCALVHVHQFIYNARFDNGLTEHEYDHVFIGHSDELPLPDPEEVMDWRYLGLKELEHELKDTPQHYSVWLNICYDEVVERISNSSLFKNLKK